MNDNNAIVLHKESNQYWIEILKLGEQIDSQGEVHNFNKNLLYNIVQKFNENSPEHYAPVYIGHHYSDAVVYAMIYELKLNTTSDKIFALFTDINIALEEKILNGQLNVVACAFENSEFLLRHISLLQTSIIPLQNPSTLNYILANDDDGKNYEEYEEAEFEEVKQETPKAKKHSKKQIVIDIDHWYNEDELKELSRQIVALDAGIDADENDMESIKQQLKSIKDEIENKDSERRTLSRKYKSGFEKRSIATIRIIDYNESKINYFDVNTDELIQSEDLQEGGFFDKKEQDEQWD